MIQKLFYSSKNLNAIKLIIENEIRKNSNPNTNLNIDNNYSSLIDKTMKYIESQISPQPPKGMEEEEYLFLMNKKLFETVVPVIKEDIKKKESEFLKELENRQKKEEKKINPLLEQFNSDLSGRKKNVAENIFDSVLLKNYEMPEIIEYPVPSTGSTIKRENQMDNKIKSLEDERSVLTPKIKPIDFSVKNEEKNDTMQRYNELLTSYSNNTEIIIEQEQESRGNPLLDSLGINISNKNNQRIEKVQAPQYNSTKTLQPKQNNNEIQNKILNKKVTFNNNLVEPLPNILEIIQKKESNIVENRVNFPILEEQEINSYQVLENKEIYNPVKSVVKESLYLICNSKYRNFEKYPNPESFEIIFKKKDNIVKFNEYIDKNNKLIAKEQIINHGIDSTVTIENIETILCKYIHIPLNKRKDSYFLLNIPELKSSYRLWNNEQKKSYTKYVASGENNTILKGDESCIYKMIENDKITVELLTKNEKPYFIENDQIFIDSFLESKSKNVVINISLEQYSDILKDDILYFYNTLPKKEHIIFLEDDIYISKIKRDKTNNILEIYIVYDKINKDKPNKISLNMNDIIKNIDNKYIVLIDKKNDYNHYFKITDIRDDCIIVNNFNYINLFQDIECELKDFKLGIANHNLAGTYDNNEGSLFCIDGYTVIDVTKTDSNYKIEIDFLFENLPSYLRKNKEYNNKSIFFIQDKLQIDYTFEIR
jgi:hypothetical protein